jgi:hypothetical protein
MGVLDFLFEGKPPTSVTTYGTNTASLPQWMSDYTQGLIAKANQVGAEPYQPYNAPRVAGFSGDQTKAQQMVRDNTGNYKPYFDEAGALASAGGNTDITGAAAPYMAAASKTLPGNVNDYMNPYVGGVINRAELEANRNFNENIMPTLDNKFTSSGQYGSSAHEREANRAARDLTEGVQSQSLGALSQAYNTAGTQFQADASRQAQLAATAGNQAQQEGALALQAGTLQGNLGEATQAAGLKDVAALDASGSEQQQQGQRNLDTAYGDFQAQRDFPKTQVDWLSSVIRGLPAPTSTSTTSTGPASVYQPSALSQIGSILTAGKGISDIFNSDNSNTPVKARGGYIRKAKGGSVPHSTPGIRARRPGALNWVTT